MATTDGDHLGYQYCSFLEHQFDRSFTQFDRSFVKDFEALIKRTSGIWNSLFRTAMYSSTGLKECSNWAQAQQTNWQGCGACSSPIFPASSTSWIMGTTWTLNRCCGKLASSRAVPYFDSDMFFYLTCPWLSCNYIKPVVDYNFSSGLKFLTDLNNFEWVFFLVQLQLTISSMVVQLVGRYDYTARQRR